jgi:5,10-methylenetetrahydrofolate reductase
VNYELNPPKILPREYFDHSKLYSDIDNLKKKILLIEKYVDGIHFTDSVLGIPRMSSIAMAAILKKIMIDRLKISCSIRTRDRNLTSMYQVVTDSILLKIDSLLILMGDEPIKGPKHNNPLKPSQFVFESNKQGFSQHIKMNLSFPSKIKNYTTIQKKIDAKPYAFVTQSIESLNELGKVVDFVKPFKIKTVACIMLPSEKNKLSAEAIGLDWKEYEKEPIEFINKAGKLADELLLTSPNHFSLAENLLKEIKC